MEIDDGIIDGHSNFQPKRWFLRLLCVVVLWKRIVAGRMRWLVPILTVNWVRFPRRIIEVP